jgi:hypothetical protein
MEPELAWTIPTSLIEDIDQWAKEEKLSRKAAIAELVRLGLTACGECHSRLAFQRAKAAKR